MAWLTLGMPASSVDPARARCSIFPSMLICDVLGLGDAALPWSITASVPSGNHVGYYMLSVCFSG